MFGLDARRRRTLICIFAGGVAALALSACLPGALSGGIGGLLKGGEKDAGGGSDAGVADAGRTFLFTGLNLDRLDSYTAGFDLDFAGQREGVAVDLTSAGSVTHQTEPKMLSIRNEISGDGLLQGTSLPGAVGQGATVTTETITTPDAVYLMVGAAGQQQCRSLPGGLPNVSGLAERLGGGGIQIEELVKVRSGQDPVKLTLVGPETVNGVATDHYTALDAEVGSLTSATIDLWYAADPGYVARLTLSGQGDVPLYGSGAIDLTYDVLSINQPVTIAVPEDCPAIDLEDLDIEGLDLEDLDLDNLDLPDLPDLPALPGG